jgi:ribulose-5-phosphate 4-epimerase/fuculose-1-phosphate aldolase
MQTEIREETQEDKYLSDHLREMVAMSCRMIAQHRLSKGSTGHVSVRIPGTNDIWVRGRPNVDKGLRFAEPSSVIRVNIDTGMPVGQTRGVSRVSEIYIHTELMKARPDVNCVIHTHPPACILCSVNQVPLLGINNDGRGMAESGVDFYPRAITLQAVDEVLPMLDMMGRKNQIILNQHGAVVCGRSIEEATNRAIGLEVLARMNWTASLHAAATGKPFSEYLQEDRDTVAQRRREAQEAEAQGRDRVEELHPGGIPGEPRNTGVWPYLVALLESGELYIDEIGGLGM